MISILIKACLSSIKAFLAPEVRKPVLKSEDYDLGKKNFIKFVSLLLFWLLDLAVLASIFTPLSSLLSTASIISSSSTATRSIVTSSTLMVLSIMVSRAAI